MAEHLIDGADDALRADLYRRLYDVTAALTAAALPDEVVSVLFAQALEVLEADAGFIGLLDESGETVHVQHFVDYSGAPARRIEVAASEHLPLIATALDGEVRVIESNEDLACDYPGLTRLNAADHACATVPLHDGERLRGALNVAFDEPRRFTPAERFVLQEIARHCADALGGAERLHRAEQSLRSRRAMVLHDDVVQDIAAAKLALELGQLEQAGTSITLALEAAKKIVTGLADGTDFRRDAATPQTA